MRYIIAYILLFVSLDVQAQVRTFHTTETDSVNIMTSPKVDTFKTYVRRQPMQTEHINLLYPRRSGTLALEDSSDFDTFMHGNPIMRQKPPYRADPFCIYYPPSNLLLNGWFVDSSGAANNLSCNWYGGADPSNVEAPTHGFFWNAYGQSGSIRAIDWIKVDTSHYYQLFFKVKIFHYGGFYGEAPSWVFYGGLEYRYMKDSDTTFAISQGVPKWGYSMTRHYGGSAITDPPSGPYGYQETPIVPMSMVVGPRKGFDGAHGIPDNAPWGPLMSEGWDMPAYEAIMTTYPTPPLPALNGFHMQIPYDSGWSLYVRPKFYMEAPFEGFNSGVGNYVQISEISFKDVSPATSGGFADTVTNGMVTQAMLKDSAAVLRQAIRDSLLVQSSLHAALYATKQALADTANALRSLTGGGKAFLALASVDASGIYMRVDSSDIQPWNVGISSQRNEFIYRYGNTLFACTYNQGVYKSTNYGLTWTASNTGMPGLPFYAKAITQRHDTLYCSTTTSGIYRSMNGGANWSSMTATGLGANGVICNPYQVTGYMYAYSSTTQYLYRSANSGANWTTLASINASAWTGQIFAVNGNIVLMTCWGSGQGFKRSTDGGATFGANFLTGTAPYAVINRGTTFLAGNGNGIYRSTDSCVSWTKVSNRTNMVFAMTSPSSDTIYAQTSSAYLMRSVNDGASWDSVKSWSGAGMPTPTSMLVTSRPKEELADSSYSLRAYTGAVEALALSAPSLTSANAWTQLQTFNSGWMSLGDRWKMGSSIIGGAVQEVSGQVLDLGVNYNQLLTPNGSYNKIFLRLDVRGTTTDEHFGMWFNDNRQFAVSSTGNLIMTGWVKGTQYKLSSLNTPPSSATASGTTGEIRFGTDGYLYLCTATNTWVRAQLVTW